MIKGVLIDLDGVVYQGDNSIEGSKESIEWLQKNNIPHLFVTNTSSKPRKVIQAKLASMGINVEQWQIFTPPAAACEWLKQSSNDRITLIVNPEILEDFQEINQVSIEAVTPTQFVVVGDLGEAWNFSILNKVFQLLMTNPKPKLIALGMTKYWKADDGLRLDVAPFVKALEYASSCEVIVTGKPSPTFYQQAIKLIDLNPENVMMIGDDINVDVLGAQHVGIKGCLVQTGKFREDDLQGSINPDVILKSLSELPQIWNGVGIE